MEVFFILVHGRSIENVTSYSHLGHIINSHSDDIDEVLQSRHSFAGQDEQCFFRFFFQDTGYANKHKIA